MSSPQFDEELPDQPSRGDDDQTGDDQPGDDGDSPSTPSEGESAGVARDPRRTADGSGDGEPAPVVLSVDNLTQAFANLLGDSSAADRGDELDSMGPSSASPTKEAKVPANRHRDKKHPEDGHLGDANSADVNLGPLGTDGESPDGESTDSERSGEDAGSSKRASRRPRRSQPHSLSENTDWDDPQGDTPPSGASIVEAILFVGHPDNQPITARLMASYLRGVSPDEVDLVIEELNRRYLDEDAPYEIASEGSGYQMRLRQEFVRVRDAFYGKIREAKLSQSAIDLLALVAYRQPVTREQLDEVRGQRSSSILNQLVRRELLSIEYTDTKPRRKLYRTTARFLELFGLETLEDLPHHEEA